MYRAKNEIKRLDRICAEKTAQFNELLDVCVSYIAASKVREFILLYMGKFWQEKQLANRELFAKIFVANIHRCTENLFSIRIVFAKFFLTNTCMVCQNFPLCQIFRVYGNTS